MSLFKPKTPSNPDSFSILLPGISPETALLSEQLLTRNNKEFHIFFNEKKFHNHLIHHLLAAYSFGATKEKIQEIFDIHAKDQRPLPPSIGTVTRENLKEYLGKAESYTSFLDFFESEIEQHGALDTVRRFVWSGDFLARTVSGLYHPLIHIGYGLEFGIPGTVAEGLAMAACTDAHFSKIVPSHSDLLLPVQAENDASTARDMFTQFARHFSVSPTAHHDVPDFLKDNQLLKILGEMRKDAAFDLITYNDPDKLDTLLASAESLERINDYVNQWKVEDIQASLKELYTTVALLLGATGVREGYPLRLDFGFMHALTSVEFVHQYVARIASSESVSLLRAHLAITLVYYAVKGRPTFNIDGLLKYNTSQKNSNRNNGWLDVFDRSLSCKEAHVLKAVRSCAVGQTIYGPYNNTHLNTIWLNISQMVCDKDGQWDFDSLGFDESWKKLK